MEIDFGLEKERFDIFYEGVMDGKYPPNGIQYHENAIHCHDKNGVWDLTIPTKTPRLTFGRMLEIYTMLPVELRPDTDNQISPFARIGSNCSIGGPGFGYEQDEDGSWFHIPHLGRVVIEDDVTIHNNTCIDRGVIGDTVIGEGTKIDNLVHIAHNVKIGKRCLIISNCNIGGSSEIGDNVYMGMSVTVINKVRIGNNVKIGAGALILKDIPDDYPDWIKGVWRGLPFIEK